MFNGGNYMVCNYCISLIRGGHRDGSKDGCKLIQNSEGIYARKNVIPQMYGALKSYGIDFVDGINGCEKFESSGVPAHPEALEVLVKRNPRCSSIPSYPKALENSDDFYSKVEGFLPKENIVSYRKVQ